MGKSGGWKRAYCVFLLCAATRIASPAQTFTTLASFDGNNGGQPVSSVVQGTNGSFYGTTASGGTYGEGTVFKVTSAGTLTALYSFCAQTNCADGRQPDTAPIQATDGNFYGATTFGGIDGNDGTIFKITPQGTLTTLYEFCSQSKCADGTSPYAGLIQAADGNLYGTTNEGGDLNCFSPYGCGTVFKISLRGKLTTLHQFHSTEGNLPFAGVVQARDGSFYGTTAYGGANNYGTVFRITSEGKLTTVYSFCAQAACAGGYWPYGTLTQVDDGNFYGTTEGGGASGGFGTVFTVTPAGALTTLHSFDVSDGSDPNDGLVQAADGNFYGTTEAGGGTNLGTAFKITPDGTLTTLVSFGTHTQSAYPSVLFQATNGNFYGTTQTGGANNDGTVFSLSVGLGPFVETNPMSGKVGTPVIILGTNLKGTTSVTFNGAAARFTVVSKSEIKIKVPRGATTGFVTATTPGGKLKSNKKFRVVK